MRATMRLAVFCGPSLPPCDRIEHERVDYLLPASRGDVERAAREYDAILLIDGVFHHDLAPSPKECYRAAQHVRMSGASSMGALRAAECWPYGLLPLGIIARWYMREVIDGDDEVAVLTHPQTNAAVTVPSVNVRYVAELARRRKILSRNEAITLVADSRAVFYMDRSWDDVIDATPLHAREAVERIAKNEGDLKRWDARFALRRAMRNIGLPALLHQEGLG